jgi:hypothetical protein
MPQYSIEVIHEPSGSHMNFFVDSEAAQDEVWNEVIRDLSVVAHEEV